MDQWELASRRYKQIVPEPIVAWNDFPKAKVQNWLESDVCGAVEEFVPRARFQEYASWAVRVFAENSDSDELQLVGRLSAQLRDLANSLTEFIATDSVREALRNRYQPSQFISSETTVIGADRDHAVDREVESIAEWEFVSQQLESLLQGCSEPLVKVHDFFSPLPVYVETEAGEIIQRADTIVSINPRLHPVGDFIVRAMFERTQPSVELLLEVSRHCLAAPFKRSKKRQSLLEDIQRGQEELESIWRELQERFLTGPEFRKRNSCVILTQIYAAYHPNPKLQWLELSEDVVQRGQEVIRHRLKESSNAEMTDRIAVAVNELGNLYDADEDPQQTAFETAITQKRLVISKDAQQYYFDQEGPRRLNGRSWDCFLALARAARCKRYITVSDVYGDAEVGPSTLPTAIERLLERLPGSMIDLITPGRATGGYLLKLEREQVAIF